MYCYTLLAFSTFIHFTFDKNNLNNPAIFSQSDNSIIFLLTKVGFYIAQKLIRNEFTNTPFFNVDMIHYFIICTKSIVIMHVKQAYLFETRKSHYHSKELRKTKTKSIM